MTELKTSSADQQDALRLRELVIELRAEEYIYTAYACCAGQIGVNLCLHEQRSKDPGPMLDRLIEGVEKLGIQAESYRIVREDLPPQPVVEHRYPASLEAPFTKRSPDEECEIRGHPLRDGQCEEENVAEQGEARGCLYCTCMNETESGETCSECQAGAHQG